MRIPLTIIPALLLNLSVRGQEFGAQSALPQVSADGFYKIAIPPAVSPWINDAFSNLRIVDENGVQVPFVMGLDRETVATTEFIPYTIEEKTILPDSCTILVLKNNSKTSINNINLIIKNAAIYKEAALYGSDDKETWYALKDSFILGQVNNTETTTEVKIIDFPASDYAWYKLRIIDKGSAPLNILRAGYYRSIPQAIHYEEIPVASVSQENDAERKTSTMRILPDTARMIDRINWTVPGVPFYQRDALLYTMRTATDNKGKRKEYRETLARFQINSRHENIQYLSNTKTDNLVLEVTNGDNPPLAIKDIRLQQVSRHLVAWLKKDGTYTLKFGAASMAAPSYDLEFFRDSIPATMTSILPAEVHLIATERGQEGTTLFSSRLYIWIAIVVVILILAVLSVRMIREAKRAE